MPRLRPVVLALLLSACAPREEPWDRLVLEDLDGKRVGLAASPTVLVFLESDCPVSNKYAPELARLCKEYGSRLSFFAVYPGGSPAEAESHRRSYGKPCPAVIDADRRLARAARIEVVPEAAVFVPGRGLVYHGRIDDRFADVGVERAAPTTHDLEEALRSVVKGEVPAPPTGRAVGCPVPP
jgi:thiol-disulfide isomerase/thioredoxin